MPLLDAEAKVRGRTVYMSDLSFPGMLVGKTLRSPIAHGRITRIDVAKARRVPGVRAVVTAADCAPVRWGGIVPDQYILPVDGKVRFVGDEVAGVAATSEEAAQEALSLIEVEYEELQPLLDPREALIAQIAIHDTPVVRSAFGTPGPVQGSSDWHNVAYYHHVVLGDPDAGFLASDVVLERTYQTSPQNAGFIEPVACIAEPSDHNRLTVWCPTHDPFTKKSAIARALGLAPHQVRIRQAAIGGSFGGKIHHKSYFLAGLLALHAGRPVRLLDTRAESLTITYPRMAMEIRIRLGSRRDGTFLAKQAFIVADNGAYSNSGPVILLVAADTADNLYRFQHVRNEGLLVYTNKVPSGPLRGYGNPQHTFALESLVDEMALELGIDPLDLRLKNAVCQGDVTVHGFQLHSCGLKECLEAAAKRSDWAAQAGRQPAVRTAGDRAPARGLGLACCLHKSGARKDPRFEGAAARIKATPDGLITILCGEPELGEGAHTVWALIAAQELGIGVERVAIAPFDTDYVPFGFGTWASRLTTMAGKAVLLACQDLKRQAIALTAQKWEVGVDVLSWSRGAVEERAGRSLTLQQLAEIEQIRSGGQELQGQGECIVEGLEMQGAKAFGNLSMAYSFAVHVAEVEVDLGTGLVRVNRLVAAHDLGHSINPLMAEGQIEGGAVQGVGFGVLEQLCFDNRGRVIHPTLLDYKLPTFPDAPRVEPILFESMDPFGPFGAKGLSEPAIVPTAAAIANAFARATGVRIRHLPLIPERVWRALRESAKAGPGSAQPVEGEGTPDSSDCGGCSC